MNLCLLIMKLEQMRSKLAPITSKKKAGRLFPCQKAIKPPNNTAIA